MLRIVKSVVIATKDPVVINQLSSILMQHDYSILIEKSTIKSILKVLEQKIDFLILDMDFPQNTNMDLIDIIRKTRPKLPIIVLSKSFSHEILKKLAQAGVFYCAFKPLQIDELEKLIEALKRFDLKREKMGSLIYKNIEQ